MSYKLLNTLHLLQINFAERSIKTVSQSVWCLIWILLRWESEVVARIIICANVCLATWENIALRVYQLIYSWNFFDNFVSFYIDDQQSTRFMKFEQYVFVDLFELRVRQLSPYELIEREWSIAVV